MKAFALQLVIGATLVHPVYARAACMEQPLPPNKTEVANGLVNSSGATTDSFTADVYGKQSLYVMVTNQNVLPAPVTVQISSGDVGGQELMQDDRQHPSEGSKSL